MSIQPVPPNTNYPIPPDTSSSRAASSQGALVTGASTSPTEEQRIVFDVFDAIILLMQKMQVTLSEELTLQAVYNKLAEQQTQEISRVPLYLGGASSDTKVNLTDLSKFTLGYSELSIQEILESVLASNQKFNIPAKDSMQRSFGNTTAGEVLNGCELQYFTLTPTPTGFTASFDLYYGFQTATKKIEPNIQAHLSTTISYPTNATAAEKMKAATDAFISLYDKVKVHPDPSLVGLKTNTGVPITIQDPNFPWPYNRVHHGEDTAGAEWAEINADYSTRASINQRQQQTIETLRAKRETTNNLMEQAQTTMENLSTSIKSLVGILQSMIQSMRNMMQSFR